MEKITLKQIKILIIALLSLGFAISISVNINISIEKKLEARYQEGIQGGRDEVFSEIKFDLETIKGYRFPIKKEDGTDGFRILIEIPSQ